MLSEVIAYFSDFTWKDVIDISIVFLLIFQLYRSVKGSIAFNIFIGSLIIYVLSLITNKLDLKFTGGMVNRFIEISWVGLIILFQPEIRKFLINLGRRPASSFFKPFFKGSGIQKYHAEEEVINESMEAIHKFIEQKVGATLVIARSDKYQLDTNTGVLINGLVSSELLNSIHSPESPLKEGAVLIDNNQIVAAGITLPISDSQKMASHRGLRHRGALGAAESGEVIAIVVSQETQEVSVAKDKVLMEALNLEEVKKLMYEALVG
jgi:uncharacterized protein (TIGR00159 family)